MMQRKTNKSFNGGNTLKEYCLEMKNMFLHKILKIKNMYLFFSEFSVLFHKLCFYTKFFFYLNIFIIFKKKTLDYVYKEMKFFQLKECFTFHLTLSGARHI